MRILQRLEAEWWDAKQDLDRMTQEAASTKSSLPNNYWAIEHEARMKLEAARRAYQPIKEAVREALTDLDNERIHSRPADAVDGRQGDPIAADTHSG